MPFKDPHVNVGISPQVHQLLVFYARLHDRTISEMADLALVQGLVALAAQATGDGNALTQQTAAASLKDLARHMRLG